ncbi:MAG TPA: endolytic transglycosylase MltG [Acidimicrobiia bacterium]|nr:endolytic transglycosylase MltG [Acidimicrobiia bacterium]
MNDDFDDRYPPDPAGEGSRRDVPARPRRGAPAGLQDRSPYDQDTADVEGDTWVASEEPTFTRAQRQRANLERARRRRRNLRVLVVLAIILLPFVIGGVWFYLQLNPTGDPGAPVAVQIKDGWGTSEVADALSAKGVIGSTLAFKVWAAVTRAGPFKPGRYEIPKDIGVRGAMGYLEKGPIPEPEIKLLLPPGLTLNQIAERVAQIPGHTKEGFLKVVDSGQIRSAFEPAGVNSLEGLLFPDTYFIGPSESDESIVHRLVARFDEIATKVGLANSQSTNGLTPYQTIVSASLIQTEAKLAEDAPLISAVVVNRLHQGMALQIDSTLCYAKGGCPPLPTNADKKSTSPYNTYVNKGLPPTPIASVTQANLDAALHPAAVPYLYYVIADKNGKHAFATTLEEHNKNVAAAKAKGLL